MFNMPPIKQPHQPATPPDLAALRARLQTAQGPEYWRSLEELAGSQEFQEFLHREFPHQAAEWSDMPVTSIVALPQTPQLDVV